MTEDDLIASLKPLLAEHGYLSEALIDADLTLPSVNFYRARFGSIRRAYELAGFRGTHAGIVRAAYERKRTARSGGSALS